MNEIDPESIGGSSALAKQYRLAVINSHPIQYFAPLYRRLAEEPDIDLTVYFCSRAGAEEYEDEGFGGKTFAWDVPLLEGYDHVFVPNLRGERSPGGFWSLVNPSIVQALRRKCYDAVWLHGHAYASYLLGMLGGKVAGSALFMRCDTHLGLDRSRVRRTLRGPVMTGFYQFFDACLAIGSRNAEFYRRHGVGERKIFLVPYVVDNRRFCEGARVAKLRLGEVRRALGLPSPNVPVVLFLSKLISRKRPMDLLRAFKQVQDRQRGRLSLAVVGEGPEQSRVEKFVEEKKVPDVHLLGFRNQSELPEIYAACDVFVLPSENEAWGLVVNEAMCAGLPVLSTEDVGASADLVQEGKNGFQYPVGDVSALADRLTRLVEDEDLRERMGRVSLQIIEEWDLNACVEGIREALEATCGIQSEKASTQGMTSGSEKPSQRIGG